MNILITGIAGFIGSSTAKQLVKENNIIGIDNFNDHYSPEIKKQNIKNLEIKFYQGDITDKQFLEKIFTENKIDKIIHLAAMVGVRPSIIDPSLYESVNIGGTLNLLELARKHSIKNFVFSSSSSVYGNTQLPFSEGNKTIPLSPYGATKLSCEILCQTYNALYKLPIVCLRFFTVYGPNGRPDMAIYKFTKKILNDEEIEMYGSGSSSRDYTFITDIVDGIIKSLNLETDFQIINLGNSNPIKLKDLITLIETTLNKKANIVMKDSVKGDVDHTYANITISKNILNFEPKVSIEEGVRLFCEWFKENRLI